ncbi:Neurocan core protein [Holothuria leucospilota]|uniref:Neurocan core protein n=1 Tax=Holothuria leucospilota TaxID=206669 RepID=A0A9Q1CF56_HOLLE|nr:Neurocan core protein [Holothuria leucospilota]
MEYNYCVVLLSVLALHFQQNWIVSAFTCSSKDLPDVRHGSFVCDELANICTLQCKYGYYPSSATEISCTNKQYLTGRDAWKREFICTECNQPTTFSVSWGNTEYLFVKKDHTWNDAYKMCQLRDTSAQLASIESKEENEFIQTILYQCINESHVWIGLNDISTEGNWKWSSTSANFFNWGRADPTVYEPDGGKNENCVVMSRSTGKWHDVACEWLRFSVCKRKLHSTRIRGKLL